MIIQNIQSKVTEKEGNRAVFEVSSLYPGYGVTIGNSLRRVLLSSLPGAAVTQVKIKGVSHEFSTIPGVKEDAIFLMLNLKQLRFKMYSDEPQKATLKIKGEKDVKASDFEFPSQIELINKNAHIATLTSKSAELEMEITIEKGVGYSSRESRKATQAKLEIGVIPVDAIFTPVKKVSYKIENMRVGERTDFDKLSLDLETDGTMDPEQAVFQAAEILAKQFSFLVDTYKKEEKVVEEKKTTDKKEKVSAKKKPAKKNEKKIKGKKTA